jgi:hypothetical protein
MKGETLLERWRREYGSEPVTKHRLRKLGEYPSDYVEEVIALGKEAGIVKDDVVVKKARGYRIDPVDGLACPIDRKPYDDSVCVKLEELIDECARMRVETGCSCRGAIARLAKLMGQLYGAGADRAGQHE